MMRSIYFLVFCVICACSNMARAQDSPAYSADHEAKIAKDIPDLKIGQKVPGIYLHKILNYKDTAADLSEFYNGKLLIVDFWATWCPPCIASLPVLDSIQKRFADRIKIITVTYESAKKVNELVKRNRVLNSLSLPFVVEDENLNSYFRHRTVPHEVWIDSSGRVRAITNNYDVTEQNIDKILSEDNAAVLTKKDSVDFDPALYSDFSDSNILFRSVLAESNMKLNGGFADAIEGYKYYRRLYLTNRTPMQLFYFAFSKGTAPVVNFSNVIYNTVDSLRYTFTPTRALYNNSDSLQSKYGSFEQWVVDWAGKNSYCYELIEKNYLPDTVFFNNMMQDLNRYFKITATVKQREIPCIVIKLGNPGDTHLLKTSGLKTYTFWSGEKADTLKRIQNDNWTYLISLLNSFKFNDPVVDETGFSGRVDLDMDLGGFARHEKFDVAALKKALSKYGLKIVRERRPTKVLVINDRE